jgi:hypothetical protein
MRTITAPSITTDVTAASAALAAATATAGEVVAALDWDDSVGWTRAAPLIDALIGDARRLEHHLSAHLGRPPRLAAMSPATPVAAVVLARELGHVHAALAGALAQLPAQVDDAVLVDDLQATRARVIQLSDGLRTLVPSGA